MVDRYLPLVRSVTRAYRLPDRDAEDVGQTVWLRLVEHLASIREPRALPKWIMTTAKHESLRVIGSTRRAVALDPLPEPHDAGERVDVDAELLRAERQQALRDGLAELPAAQRELLLLLVADPPVSYREISERLGMPVGSIGPTRARCLARLRATGALRAFLQDDPADHPGGGRDEPRVVARRR
nr:sigma-70 family RNA polymerase sigma factor [Modestobacter marinus]